VECWEDNDILQAAGLVPDPILGKDQERPVKTVEEAIRRIGDYLKTHDDYRKDIEATAF
jgi:hypothetical protein